MPESDSLSRFGAHQKAIRLFDWVVADLTPLAREPALQRLISQQYASADSIAANINHIDCNPVNVLAAIAANSCTC